MKGLRRTTTTNPTKGVVWAEAEEEATAEEAMATAGGATPSTGKFDCAQTGNQEELPSWANPPRKSRSARDGDGPWPVSAPAGIARSRQAQRDAKPPQVFGNAKSRQPIVDRFGFTQSDAVTANFEAR
jgi:hypothetical protein